MTHDDALRHLQVCELCSLEGAEIEIVDLLLGKGMQHLINERAARVLDRLKAHVELARAMELREHLGWYGLAGLVVLGMLPQDDVSGGEPVLEELRGQR